MVKIISNIIALVIILVSLFPFSMSVITLVVTDWSRWSDPVPLVGIAFGLLCAATGWWSLCLVPHFAAPFKVVPKCITRWLEENNKFCCPPVHTGYEPVTTNLSCQIIWYGMGQDAQSFYVEDHDTIEKAIASFAKDASDLSFVHGCLYVEDKLVARAARYSYKEYEIVIV